MEFQLFPKRVAVNSPFKKALLNRVVNIPKVKIIVFNSLVLEFNIHRQMAYASATVFGSSKRNALSIACLGTFFFSK